MTLTLTTPQNQINNIKGDTTNIELGECETLLRQFYNLTNNNTLYIIKIEVKQNGMKFNEYDVYSKLGGINLVKLNISICRETKIALSIPITLPHELDTFYSPYNYDIFNSSSDFCNDICFFNIRKWVRYYIKR